MSDGSGKGKRPTGEAYPAVGGEKAPEPDGPLEVVFKAETFRKLIVWTLGPVMLTLIGAISAFFYFYHQTHTHMADPTIHLTRGERSKLETKEEAKTARKGIKNEIKDHFDVKVRELRVEQNEQVSQLGRGLKAEQKEELRKILSEVKKARRDIKGR